MCATLSPDVDVKKFAPKNYNSEKLFSNWATKHILCLTNTAMKWGIKYKDASQMGWQKQRLDNLMQL